MVPVRRLPFLVSPHYCKAMFRGILTSLDWDVSWGDSSFFTPSRVGT